MNRFRSQIRSALEAVHVDFPKGFSWFGKRYDASPAPWNERLDDEQQAGFLHLRLQDHLYRRFYCSGGVARHEAAWDSAIAAPGGGRFATRLSEANAGRGFWDPGWHVCALGTETVGLMKEGLTIHAPSEHCRGDRGRSLAVGETAALRHPPGSFHRSPGFYVVYGEEPFEPFGTGRLLRIYWNIGSDGAAGLVGAVTRRLNRDRVPFIQKALDDPRRYARCDSAVLYLARGSYAACRTDHLPHVRSCIAGHLHRGIPALTRELCPGVGLAEAPLRHGSFGFDRCGVLARGMISISREGATSLRERLAGVEREFERWGLDPRRPYLEAGSSEDYGAMAPHPGKPRGTRAPRRAALAAGVERYLVAARDIGGLIARRAVWHGEECNWLSALGPSSQPAAGSSFGSMGSSLYDGTAGVALFLGHLSTVDGDQAVRATALGAIRHAMGHCQRHPPPSVGLYVGHLGVALVAASLGALLDREDLLEGARRLAKGPPATDTDFDLISGAAGRIVGALLLEKVLDDQSFLDMAHAAGEQLLRSAVRSDRGVSWSSDHVRGGRHLTGLSHGAAGAGYALLELSVRSGRDEFRRAAAAAFAYERSVFRPREANWPDFRDVDERDADDPSTVVPCSTTWCHGAPGIAVSRMRAAKVLSDGSCFEEARLALNTTRDHLRGWLLSNRANYSLCHGVAGNADILLSAVRSGGPVDGGVEEVIDEEAEVGLERYGPNPSRWPCGVGGGGASPSLMLGWAGIGNFYLRLARVGTPSPMVPHTWDSVSAG